MTEFDVDVLERAVPGVRAWEQLQDPEFAGKLDMDGLYRLLLKAGYSEEVAQQAARQRGWDRLSAGEVM